MMGVVIRDWWLRLSLKRYQMRLERLSALRQWDHERIDAEYDKQEAPVLVAINQLHERLEKSEQQKARAQAREMLNQSTTNT